MWAAVRLRSTQPATHSGWAMSVRPNRSIRVPAGVPAGVLATITMDAAMLAADSLGGSAFASDRLSLDMIGRWADGLLRGHGGGVIAALGWGLLSASPMTLASALLLLAFFDLKSRREEAWLGERFDGYAAYRRRTRRLIPWIY